MARRAGELGLGTAQPGTTAESTRRNPAAAGRTRGYQARWLVLLELLRLPPPSITAGAASASSFTSVASSGKPGLGPSDGQRLGHCLTFKGVWGSESLAFSSFVV